MASKMTCCSCGRQIELNSIFCNWCGESQIKQKRREGLVSVPAPRQLPSGNWTIELRREHKSFTDPDPEVCKQQATAYRVKWLQDEAAGLHVPKPKKKTLRSAIDNYIASKSNILSPSTIRSYESVKKYRFQQCMGWDINLTSHNWQMAINKELDDVSPKTVVNAWRLITAALNFANAPVPSVSLPRVPRAERHWLTYEQIKVFMDAIKGESCELPCLLALNSLRLSELLALQPCDYIPETQTLRIRGSRVLNSQGELVFKELNKTDASSRDVRVVIPRLKELLDAVDPESEWIVNLVEKRLYDQINRICDQIDLPPVGIHGLRHSFASLAYHLGCKEMSVMQTGGWSNSRVVHEIYTHNADLDADLQTMTDFYS